MSENRKCFTFTWKIKNFTLDFKGEKIISPTFYVQGMGETKWELELYSNSKTFKDCVAYYFRRKYDCGPNVYELDLELCFLSGDGSVLHSETFLKRAFRKISNWNPALYVKRDEVFLHKNNQFIPDDTLTICCRLWENKDSLLQSGRCFAETRIEIKCGVFVGNIGKFSSAAQNGRSLVCINSSSIENFLSSMNLWVTTDGKLVIEIKLVDEKSIDMYRYKLFIRDSSGNKLKSGQGDFGNKNPHCIPLTLSKEHLFENRRYYLPEDVLTIECEIIFPPEKTTNKIDEPEYGFECQDFNEIAADSTKASLSSKEHHIKKLTLMDDLNSLFNEGILYDTKLKTATETFPAHTLVLSARSSVFKSMFTTDMREKTNNCVVIDDLDADTVRRMLSFIYLDTLDDMEYESAKSLYFAADKYNIVVLKSRSSHFLQLNIQQSNCCDVLLLADTHHDKDLKIAVQDYIAKNDEAVLFSDEWKNFEKDHPQLTIETLRAVYVKNRKRNSSDC